MARLKIQIRPNIAGIRPYVPGRPISEVVRELGIDDCIKLASNENSLGPSPMACAAISRALGDIHRYPEADQVRQLKKALSEELGVRPEEIILGNGSNEILELVTRAYVNPDDEILTSESTFLVYEGLIQIAAAQGCFAPLKNYTYDLNAIAGLISNKTRVIFISNPNNPTGTALTRDAVKRFLKRVPEHVLVVFDEAYYDFTDGRTFPDLLKNQPENVIVVRTFSKSYGLAGLRIGYGIARPEIVSVLNKTRQPFNVNALALVAAEAALADKQHLRATQKMVRDGKEYLTSCFVRAGVPFVKSAANFMLFTLSVPGKQAAKAFLKQGVIVREMDVYGFKNSLRVTIGTWQENRRFAKALTAVSGAPSMEERTA